MIPDKDIIYLIEDLQKQHDEMLIEAKSDDGKVIGRSHALFACCYVLRQNIEDLEAIIRINTLNDI